ncbi:MAG: YbhB/YbcL family Raf kinase inhibitor-like protein [Gemmatimonadota bacterium]
MTETGGIQLRSSAFDDGEEIPERNSAYGENVSPELSWSGIPDEAETLALVVRDPDAPSPSPFVHWVVYNIPADADGLPEGLPPNPVIRSPREIAGSIQGPTDAKRPGYFGPRPPAGHGTHHYIFTLYAVDAGSDELGLEQGMHEGTLMDAVEDRILAEGELTGLYEKER